MKKLVYYIGILVCTCVFLPSCIKEDLSDCPPDGLIPQFRLVPYEGNNIINDSLYSAIIYVFDEQDRFVRAYQISGRPELNTVYTPDWGLPPGKYHFSAWLNHHEKVSVDPCVERQSTRKNTTVGLTIPSTNIIDNPSHIPFLCFGKLENQEVDTARHKLFTIPVMQLTNRINFKITGLNQSPLRASSANGDDYLLSIEDNNGVYGFDGDFATSDKFKYSIAEHANSDTLKTSLTVMKLSKLRPNPVISVQNRTSGAQLVFPEVTTNNLIQLILLDNPNNDFDKNHIYNLNINLAGDGSEISITVTVTIIDWTDGGLSNQDLNNN